MKINYIEMKGNLTSDVKRYDEKAFITVALWNGKDKDDKDHGATFVDVALFGKLKDTEELVKGQKVEITAKLSNYTDGKTGYKETGITATSLKVIPKKSDEKEVVEDIHDTEALTKDVPFETTDK